MFVENETVVDLISNHFPLYAKQRAAAAAAAVCFCKE